MQSDPFENRNIVVAGHLHLPNGFKSARCPAIVCVHRYGAVKDGRADGRSGHLRRRSQGVNALWGDRRIGTASAQARTSALRSHTQGTIP